MPNQHDILSIVALNIKNKTYVTKEYVTTTPEFPTISLR
jgi:hypothetical protein